MSWTPDLNSLEQLKLIFRGTISSNNQERKAANEALIEARQQPEIDNYLFYILVEDSTAKSETRAAAGINLKNSILKSDGSTSRQYLLDNILKGLLVQDTIVRNITGNVITSLFSQYGIVGWPQALPQLFELAELQSADYKAQEAAMSALAKMCEDSFMALNQEYNGQHPLNYVVPKLLVLMCHPSSGKIRAFSILSANYFIPLKAQAFLVHLDQYLTNLFTLAGDADPEVRKNICTSFSLILETRPDKLMPHLDGVIDYCLHLMQDQEGEVALEACEFLLALSTSAESESDKRIFAPKLKTILPVLLEKMVYTDEDVFLLQIADEKDNANVADREEDIAPQHAKSKDSHQIATKSNSSLTNNNKSSHDSDSEFDDDEDDDSDDDEDGWDQWSVRKCAAATIDVLSLNLAGEVLHEILPLLQERIVSQSWTVREAAILAFGAISKSCMELAGDKLPQLVPFLVERLQDPETSVRQITCWTISRYSTWVAEEAHEGGHYANYFQPTFQSIVTCALDNKKLVQIAACSALSSFIEESDASLLEFYIGPLLNHFASCFKVYQKKNMLVLYDCVQTFVDKMGYEHLSKPEHINALLPPLLDKWQQLLDDDNELWSLLECMSSVAISLAEAFAPYAVPVYERAIKILANCIQLDQQCHTDPTIETPDKDFMVTSLDLIDGLIQGFGDHSVDLIQQNGANLMELLLLCFEDYNVDVRQSAYALLGDLAISAMSFLKPSLHPIFMCIGNEINNRSFSSYPVINNAIWALGEMAMRLDYNDMKPYLANLVDLLIPLINSTDSQQTLLENCAICLGRMGINGGAEILSPKLPQFILQWCAQMICLIENNEKESGFLGMIKIIHGNPDQGFGGLSNQQGRKNLATFISCIGTYAEPTEELSGLFGQLLKEYQAMLGPEVWQSQILSLVDTETREYVQQVYQV